MSHITTEKLKITLKESTIKKAISLMGKDFQGLTCEDRNGVIFIRYKPIEGYQTKGNMRFVKNRQGNCDMQLDHYRCGNELEKVKNSFLINYLKVPILQYASMNGYSTTTTKKEKKEVLVTTMW